VTGALATGGRAVPAAGGVATGSAGRVTVPPRLKSRNCGGPIAVPEGAVVVAGAGVALVAGGGVAVVAALLVD
jgi:hypothetical protein